MLKIFFAIIIAITLGMSTLQAQIRKIPASVTEAFQKKYPDATGVEWKDKITVFQATFDDSHKIAKFSSSGEWKSTEEIIDTSEIPEEVMNGFEKSKYADWDIKEASKIYQPNQAVQYKFSVSGESIVERKLLVFSQKGQLLRDALKL